MDNHFQQTLVDLCLIFAKDDTENANLLSVNIIKESFNADAVALFYVDEKGNWRYCLAGSNFPISLQEKRWKESVRLADREENKTLRFGPWSVPGIEEVYPFWISRKLYSLENSMGFILLGRKSRDWVQFEEQGLGELADSIKPVILIRLQKNKAEAERSKAESALVQREKRLRILFETSPEMIYTANTNDEITSINRAGLRLLQLERVQEALGISIRNFMFNPDDRTRLIDRVQKNGYAADYEIVLKRKDNSVVFCVESVTAIRDRNGRIREIQGIVKDISERIHSERELWKANLELSELTNQLRQTQSMMVQHEKLASIGQLAAGIAHEINNPLSFLKSNNTMISRYIKKLVNNQACTDNKTQELLEELQEILDESEEGFTRIMGIVGDLKSFSRIDREEGFGLYDLNKGIDSTLVVAWNEIKYVAEIEKDYAVIPNIQARGGEINQVLLNILVNAAQAIASRKNDKKGKIRIKTILRKTTVCVEIEDTGPGIPQSVRSRIFEPFYTTKEPGKGTGLGLSISYNIIVTNHHGNIRVESTEGKGSCFIIELPLQQPA